MSRNVADILKLLNNNEAISLSHGEKNNIINERNKRTSTVEDGQDENLELRIRRENNIHHTKDRK